MSEIAVRALLPIDGKGSAVLPGIYTTPAERAALATIGRLLEGEEADGIVTTQWVTDQKRELTQDTTTYRKLITQEWPDKQEAEGE